MNREDRLISECFHYPYHILPSYCRDPANEDPISEVSLMKQYIYMTRSSGFPRTIWLEQGLLTFCEKEPILISLQRSKESVNRIEWLIVKNIRAEY